MKLGQRSCIEEYTNVMPVIGGYIVEVTSLHGRALVFISDPKHKTWEVKK